MPYGYAFLVVYIAVATALSWCPVRRGRWAVASFQAAVVLNEAPIIGIVALAVFTWLAWDQSSLHGVAWIFVGLAALTELTLLMLLARGVRDARVISSLLTAELGQDSAPHGWLRHALLPMARRRRGVQRIADLAYGPGGRRQMLDLYVSRGRSAEAAPVFVHFHGGRFRHGRKNGQAVSLLYYLASRGWVCVSANYRLQPRATYAEQVADVEATLDWLRAHAGEWGLDASRIVLSGTSAGAHLAAYVGFDPQQDVKGVVGLGGYYGPVDDRGLSPKQRIGTGIPPVLIVHGEDDTLVPIEYVRRFVLALDEGSDARVVFTALPRTQHAFDFWNSARFAAVAAGIETFVEQVTLPAATGS